MNAWLNWLDSNVNCIMFTNGRNSSEKGEHIRVRIYVYVPADQ